MCWRLAHPGDFPEHMMTMGKDVGKYFNSKGVVFERTEDGEGFVCVSCRAMPRTCVRAVPFHALARSLVRPKCCAVFTCRACPVPMPRLLHPKKTSLEKRLKGCDPGFLSLVTSLLSLDPAVRWVGS